MTTTPMRSVVLTCGGELVPAVELQKARHHYNEGRRDMAIKTMSAWSRSIPQNEIEGLVSGAIEAEANDGDITYQASR